MPAITMTGNGNVSSRTRSAAAAVDERVDVLVDDAAHELALPRLHRLAAERLLHEPAVGVVLGLVHLEDRVAHHLAHHVGVARRRERLAVLQHLLHGVEAERGEHVDAVVESAEVELDVLGAEHRRRRSPRA